MLWELALRFCDPFREFFLVLELLLDWFFFYKTRSIKLKLDNSDLEKVYASPKECERWFGISYNVNDGMKKLNK